MQKVFNDIGKVAAISSIAALSKMISSPLVLESYGVNLEYLKGWMNSSIENSKTVSFYTPIRGNISGISILFYHHQAACYISDLAYKRELGGTCVVGDLEFSGLSEVSNLVTDSFLTSLNQSLKLALSAHHVTIYEFGIFNEIMQRVNEVKESELPLKNIHFNLMLKCDRFPIYLEMIFDYAKLCAVIQQNMNGYKAVGLHA